MRKFFTHKFIKLVLLLLFVATYQLIPTIIYGQSGGILPGEELTTNPKIRDNVVTATVPDIVPPSAPILIYPTDELLINDATPSYVWQGSTDNVGISHYELFLDGSLKYGSIPTTATTNSQFTLTYDSGSGRYTLTPSAVISNGHHTWEIKVYDDALNVNTSVIWDFYVDTQAPSFVITSIGQILTDISSSNLSSIPTNPIELEDNEPEFIGTGESNSTVQITVQIPGESSQIINLTIDSNGNWDFQLGILPRDEVITLNFVITDQVGNISILTDLKILIIQEYIIIPPTPTPSPTITPEPTPSPEVSPTATPSASPTTLPTPTETPIPTPIIKIPILPPKEIVEIIKKDVIEVIPEPVSRFISILPQDIRESIKKTTDTIAPVGVIVATAAIPTFSFLTLLLQLGQQFSWNLILKILQAIGLIPPKEPQGMVFDSQTNEPVAFALLTITSTTDIVSERLIETVVTDVDGIYQGVQLPLGKYIISVSHQDYNFPTSKDKPSYLSIQEFYKGEEFTVNSTTRQQLFLIPVDKKAETKEGYQIKKTIRSILRKISLIDFFWPLFIFSIIITLFYPTWINFLMIGVYIFMLFKRMIKSFKKPTISGFVRNTSEEPIVNATVRISDPAKGELLAIVNTDKHGFYQTFLNPGKYQIQITKTGLIWQREGSQLSFEEADVTEETKVVDAVLQDISNIYKELFGDIA